MIDKRKEDEDRELVVVPVRPVRREQEHTHELPLESLELDVLEMLKSREVPRRWRGS